MLDSRRPGTALALGLSLLLAACARDPTRDVEARRAKYTATLSGFVVKDEPGREKPQIVLDVLVAGGSKPPLPGLTLDVSMAGADGKEKLLRRVFVDTTTVGAGGEQKTVVFDDVDYAPGDGFFVEVRNSVPAAERAQYRELQGGAP
ncbi:MAG: hypothetical protein ACREI7_07760 [Myxococcota bacterium]